MGCNPTLFPSAPRLAVVRPAGEGELSAVPLKFARLEILSAFRGAESAHEKDDKAYQQNQAKPAAADDGATKVKPAAAEQEKQNHHE